MRREMTAWSRVGARVLAAAGLLAFGACDRHRHAARGDGSGPHQSGRRPESRKARSRWPTARWSSSAMTDAAGDESTWLFGGLAGRRMVHQLDVRAERRDRSAEDPDEQQHDHGPCSAIWRARDGRRPGDSASQAVSARSAANDRGAVLRARVRRDAVGAGLLQRHSAEPRSRAMTVIPGVPLPGRLGVPARDRLVRLGARDRDGNGLRRRSTIRRAALVAQGARAARPQPGRAGGGARGFDSAVASRTITLSPCTSGDNITLDAAAQLARYTVGDSLEGNASNFLVRNAIPFFSAQDPRLPVTYTIAANGRDTTKSQDGLTTRGRRRCRRGRRRSPVVNGLDARLIEAEARCGRTIIAGHDDDPERAARRAAEGSARCKRRRMAALAAPTTLDSRDQACTSARRRSGRSAAASGSATCAG